MLGQIANKKINKFFLNVSGVFINIFSASHELTVKVQLTSNC